MSAERDKLIKTAWAYSRLTTTVPSDVRNLFARLARELENSVPVYEKR